MTLSQNLLQFDRLSSCCKSICGLFRWL